MIIAVRRWLFNRVWLAAAILAGISGCSGGSETPREVKVNPAYDNLRLFRTVYMQATLGLNRPPRNADEMKPYFAKMKADPKVVLVSPIDNVEFVVGWGADLRALKAVDGKSPVWVYEKNAHGGKRWVLEERNPKELTDAQFRGAILVPELKPPF